MRGLVLIIGYGWIIPWSKCWPLWCAFPDSCVLRKTAKEPRRVQEPKMAGRDFTGTKVEGKKKSFWTVLYKFSHLSTYSLCKAYKLLTQANYEWVLKRSIKWKPISNSLYCETSEIKLLVDMIEEAGILFYSLFLKLTEENSAFVETKKWSCPKQNCRTYCPKL